MPWIPGMTPHSIPVALAALYLAELQMALRAIQEVEKDGDFPGKIGWFFTGLGIDVPTFGDFGSSKEINSDE